MGMCTDICVDVCIDMSTVYRYACVDMCIDMCVDMCIGMRIVCRDMCIEMCASVRMSHGWQGSKCPWETDADLLQIVVARTDLSSALDSSPSSGVVDAIVDIRR